MNRGILDITHGAELYRRYEMLGEGKEETKNTRQNSKYLL